MKYLTGLYSILLLVVYAAVLQYAQMMAGFGDGAPQHFSIWTIPTLFPFAYFLFILGSCFLRHPGPAAIRVAMAMQVGMAIYLFQAVLEGAAIVIVFVAGLFGLWLLMFLEKIGRIRLGGRETLFGIGIVILVQVALTTVIYAVAYTNMGLGVESLIFVGIALASGIAGYLLSMRFVDRVRIEPSGPDGSDSDPEIE